MLSNISRHAEGEGDVKQNVSPSAVFTTEEQQAFIRFFWSEAMKPWEIYKRMQAKYRDSCVSERRVLMIRMCDVLMTIREKTAYFFRI